MNCHFYVVEPTLESKCVYCQDYNVRLCSSKWHQKDVSSVTVLTDLENKSNRTKQQEERICRSLIVQMKRGEQNLGRVYFYPRLCVVRLIEVSVKRDLTVYNLSFHVLLLHVLSLYVLLLHVYHFMFYHSSRCYTTPAHSMFYHMSMQLTV